MSGSTRDATAERTCPVSRDQFLMREKGQGKKLPRSPCSVQLTTSSRIGSNDSRFIDTLLNALTKHTNY